jgi:hypothetical protein
MLKKLKFYLLHPFTATIIGGSLGGVFSYNDLVIPAYICYIYPMVLLTYVMIKVAVSNIKSFKETLIYKKNKGTLSGTVLDSKGVPCKYFSVRMVNLDGSVGVNYGGRYMNMTNKNGEYTIHRIYPGDYIVKFYKGDILVEIPFTITDEKPEVRVDYKFE